MFAVVDTGSGLVLEELQRNDLDFTLGETTGMLEGSNGQRVRITRGALDGDVRVTQRDGDAWFDGWAADVDARKPAEKIVLFVGDRSAYVARPGKSRKDIRERYGVLRTGFQFRVPGSLMPKAGDGRTVRVFAILGGTATELRFTGGNPWARG